MANEEKYERQNLLEQKILKLLHDASYQRNHESESTIEKKTQQPQIILKMQNKKFGEKMENFWTKILDTRK